MEQNVEKGDIIEKEDKLEGVDEIILELGDIIQIESPNNNIYHENQYFIEYLDNKLIKIIDIKTEEKYSLNLKDGDLTDESIDEIKLLYKNPVKGYAKQHDLDVGKTISIVFGGIQPTIINGTITNVENDEIELKVYPRTS